MEMICFDLIVLRFWWADNGIELQSVDQPLDCFFYTFARQSRCWNCEAISSSNQRTVLLEYWFYLTNTHASFNVLFVREDQEGNTGEELVFDHFVKELLAFIHPISII